MSGRNIWDTLAREVRGGPMAFTLCVIGLIAFIVGAVLSWEDFVSSYYGIVLLEEAFGIQAVSSSWVLYVMAITPWVGQIVFIGLWLLDTSRKWALVAGVVWFILDFVSDLQFRSAGTLIPLNGQPPDWGPAVWVGAAVTFLYFTVGAELFITASSAIILTLFPDAIKELARLRQSFSAAFRDADRIMRESSRPASSGGQRNGSGGSSRRNNNDLQFTIRDSGNGTGEISD